MSGFKKIKRWLPIYLAVIIGSSTAGYNLSRAFEDYDNKYAFETEKTDENEEKDEEIVPEEQSELDVLINMLIELEKSFETNYQTYTSLIADKISQVSSKRDIVGDYAIYNLMLDKGYFSYGDFEYSFPTREYFSARGVNVAVGEGVCLNQAANMADVFTALGYDAKVVVGTSYLEGEKKPDDANHAIVYVSDGEFAYLLDPTNDTIYLRKSNLLYYSIESQEDTIRCFEPEIYYSDKYNGTYECPELLQDFFNDHKKHWDVLKAYRNYTEAAEAYSEEFKKFEQDVLLSYEEYFNSVFELSKEISDYIDSQDNGKKKRLGR